MDQEMESWLLNMYDFEIGRDVAELPARLKTEALKPIVETYGVNFFKCVSIIKAPLHLFMQGMSYERAEWLAREQLFKSPRMRPGLTLQDEMLDVEQTFRTPELQVRELQKKFLSGEETPTLPYEVKVGGDLYRMLSNMAPEVHAMLRSAMSTQLVLYWTMFEVLATDLWVEAVNARPATLGENALKADKPTSITHDMLRRYSYSLANSMGSMLKDHAKKWSFNSLEKIRDAYQGAFKKEGKDLFDGPDYKGLVTLEALRHLFVHRAGVVDDKFIKRVKNSPTYSNLKKGDRVRLDGKIIRRHVESQIAFSIALIGFIDSWLVDHQT